MNLGSTSRNKEHLLINYLIDQGDGKFDDLEKGVRLREDNDGNELVNGILTDEDLYYEMVKNVVEPISTRTKMSRMKENKGNLRYDQVVTLSDECFGMMILEDRLRLWVEVAQRKVESDPTEEEIKKKVPVHNRKLRDDDDQVLKNEDLLKIEGSETRFTVYSNGGSKDQGVLKGFGAAAIRRMNELMRIQSIRRQTEAGKEMMLQMKKRWLKDYELQEQNRGGKGKKRKAQFDVAKRAEGGSCETDLVVVYDG